MRAMKYHIMLITAAAVTTLSGCNTGKPTTHTGTTRLAQLRPARRPLVCRLLTHTDGTRTKRRPTFRDHRQRMVGPLHALSMQRRHLPLPRLHHPSRARLVLLAVHHGLGPHRRRHGRPLLAAARGALPHGPVFLDLRPIRRDHPLRAGLSASAPLGEAHPGL